MRAIDKTERSKQKERGTSRVSEFLSSIDAIASVTKQSDNRLMIRYGRQDHTKQILVLTDDGKNEGLFAEVYLTSRPHQSYAIQTKLGELFDGEVDYIFYLSGQTLFTLPAVKFRYWLDHNTDMLRHECFFESDNGCEIRHHGYIVPRQKLRSDFAKGDVRVSIFLFRQNVKTGKTDYIQEI